MQNGIANSVVDVIALGAWQLELMRNVQIVIQYVTLTNRGIDSHLHTHICGDTRFSSKERETWFMHFIFNEFTCNVFMFNKHNIEIHKVKNQVIFKYFNA